jgi:hypothetical protein
MMVLQVKGGKKQTKGDDSSKVVDEASPEDAFTEVGSVEAGLERF